MTKALEHVVDVFQRNVLRKILNIKWPEKITNEKLYEKTGIIGKWSKIIKEWRLKWYGHLLHLRENKPAKKALREAQHYGG